MNEYFAAEPDSCHSVDEFRYLLDRFGPFAGRYLAAYPDNWHKQLETHFEQWGQVDLARGRLLLRRAIENAKILNKANLTWNAEKSWMENAIGLMNVSSKPFDGVVTSRNHGETGSAGIFNLDEMELPPTAEERIMALPDEYVRVTRTLLVISGELFFIDPYLNPCNRFVAPVIEKMLQVIAKGKCQNVVCFARSRDVLGEGDNATSVSDIRTRLRQMCGNAQFRKGFVITYFLVDDELSHERMHARYVLSLKGGVRLDQGFQQLRRGRKVEVSPVGRRTHDELLRLYKDGGHDFRVMHRLIVSSE